MFENYPRQFLLFISFTDDNNKHSIHSPRRLKFQDTKWMDLHQLFPFVPPNTHAPIIKPTNSELHSNGNVRTLCCWVVVEWKTTKEGVNRLLRGSNVRQALPNHAMLITAEVHFSAWQHLQQQIGKF